MGPEELSRIVARAGAGDTKAFALLIGALEPSLRRFVTRLVGARPVVDDVLQEVFLRVWKGLAWLRDPALIRPWSFRIATREAHRLLRRELRREALVANVDPADAPDFADPAERLEIEARLLQVTPRARLVLVAH